jgi:multiple sugar transport system ATP-binding protein
MNIVTSLLSRADGKLVVELGEHRLAVDDETLAEHPELTAYEGSEVIVGIRPEDFEDAAFAGETPSDRTVTIVCSLREALGSEVLVHFPLAARDPETSLTLVARVDSETSAREGAELRLVVNTKRLHFFEPDSGLAI